MPAVLVAQYPWWSLSDPVITFAMRLNRLGLAPRLLGPELLDFVAKSYPSEDIFRQLPVLTSPDAAQVPALLEQVLDGPGPRLAVFFDEKSFLAGAAAAARLGARVFFYSTEIPDAGQFDPEALAEAFRASGARLVIQDEDRLRGYALATGYADKAPVLLPNASLPDEDYGSEAVELPGIADWGRTLVLSGSLQPEHATLETVEAFLRQEGGAAWTLLVNGWGGALLEDLRRLSAERPNVVLNTDFLSGAQIRWIYSRCRAGVVCYYNGSFNHGYCGRASGKLYWLCRSGRPVLTNDNISISRLVAGQGMGLNLLEPDCLARLEREGPELGRRARAFYEAEAARMSDTLDSMFAPQTRAKDEA